jgi:hypothetical protein
MNNIDQIEIAPRVTVDEDGSDRITIKDSDAITTFPAPLQEAALAKYFPWWLDNLADDVTGEGAAMEGILHGAENVRRLVLDGRALYEHQKFHFVGDYGDKGYIEEYTCVIQGAPTSVVVTVNRNAAGKAQHLVVNHRPRSSVLLFARVMREKYAGTPLARYFVPIQP